MIITNSNDFTFEASSEYGKMSRKTEILFRFLFVAYWNTYLIMWKCLVSLLGTDTFGTDHAISFDGREKSQPSASSSNEAYISL